MFLFFTYVRARACVYIYTASTAVVYAVKALKFMEHLHLYTGMFFLTVKIKYKQR